MLPYADLSLLDAFAAEAGRMPAIWSVWSDWGGSNAVFPVELMAGLRTRGVTPMVIWAPTDPADPTDSSFTYKKIASGEHDVYLRAWAQAAKAHGGTILLRFAHEMDGNWFPWGMGRFDNTPKRFIAAWRHIWNIFRGPEGVRAQNVKFLWTPTSPASKRPSFKSLYPGDRYVDYVGFTAFNWVRRGIPWQSLPALMAPSLATLKKFTKKPVIVAETGSRSDRGNKVQWIKSGYPAVYQKYPQVKAIVYFNVDMRPLHFDWRLTTPSRALAAYRSIATQVRFQGRIP